MRTQYACKNIAVSLITQVITILLGFISRKAFINNLGVEYLGVNGLLTNVLSMMVLIESGIGISIVYNLYKPLADNNEEKIIALVQSYKKAYAKLALILTVLSVGLYPFLKYLMKMDGDITGMQIVYGIFVIKNIISYLNAYKWALIRADQKGYIVARNNLVFDIITTVSKIMILIVTKNYILYLAIELGIFILQNLVNTYCVRKRYPYLRIKERKELDGDTRDNINKNVKAMFFHNIGGYLVYSTDNILISTFIGVAQVGIYSNYSMIINQLSNLLSPVIGGIGAGVGNLIATEDEKKVYSIFKVSFLVSFWIYSFAVIFLYNLLEPFINWWIGEGYLLDKATYLVILVNFYINGMRTSINTFKNKAGLFVQDKYMPMIEGIINLIASLILVKYFGLVGVFLGTTMSSLAIPCWNQPRIVYKELFKQPVRKFFFKYLLQIGIMLGVGGMTTICCRLVTIEQAFLALVVKGMICVTVVNILYMIIFLKTPEFQYLWKSIHVQLDLVIENLRKRIKIKGSIKVGE